MKIIAEGKEAVLAHLEQAAQTRVGKPGQYMLAQDDSGNLVAFIAGHSFIGAGTVSIGGDRLVVIDGIVVNVRQP
jgi:hypothetical protein